jgi:hypothetical protein
VARSPTVTWSADLQLVSCCSLPHGVYAEKCDLRAILLTASNSETKQPGNNSPPWHQKSAWSACSCMPALPLSSAVMHDDDARAFLEVSQQCQ